MNLKAFPLPKYKVFVIRILPKTGGFSLAAPTKAYDNGNLSVN